MTWRVTTSERRSKTQLVSFILYSVCTQIPEIDSFLLTPFQKHEIAMDKGSFGCYVNVRKTFNFKRFPNQETLQVVIDFWNQLCSL